VTTQTLPTLLQKTDNVEIIRDQIAAIISAESISQQALATAGGEDPDLYKMQVYIERSNPWAVWLYTDDDDAGTVDISPIVNVWIDSVNFDSQRSPTQNRQHTSASILVDVYGYGRATGTTAGDKAAALSAQRTARWIRNWIMSDLNYRLQLGSAVSKRWVRGYQSYQPQLDQTPQPHVLGFRVTIDVEFNEFAPINTGEPLEVINVNINSQYDIDVQLDVS
jgi:hypothetical protein